MILGRSLAMSCLLWAALAEGFAREQPAQAPPRTPQPVQVQPAAARLQKTLSRYGFTQAHMGTLFKIILYAPDQDTATEASKAAFNRIAELDHIMSDYQPGSELMQLCQHAGGPPVKVSEDLFRVMEAAQDLSKRSDGAFDITIGPVVRLWRRARRRHEMPDPERLAAALELVGYDKLQLNPTTRTVQLATPGMLLDLGAIAKGYAADEGLRVLKQHGVDRALVAAGGDIALGSPPPRRKGWRISIAPLESPDDGQRKPQAENPKSKTQNVLLHDRGISTSGDAEQHVEIGGVRYSHIVNPKTGVAVTGRNSVTVIAPDDTTADGLATAVSVLGPERGIKLIESMPGTAALIVQVSEQGTKSFESKFPAALPAKRPNWYECDQ